MFGKKKQPRKPRVGDSLWYWAAKYECGPHPDGQPLASLVTHINEDETVNLAVFSIAGTPHSRESVDCLAPGQVRTNLTGSAEWPYEEKP